MKERRNEGKKERNKEKKKERKKERKTGRSMQYGRRAGGQGQYFGWAEGLVGSHFRLKPVIK